MGLVHNPVGVVRKVACSCVDDPHLAAVSQQRRRNILQAEQRRAELLGRGRIDEQYSHSGIALDNDFAESRSRKQSSRAGVFSCENRTYWHVGRCKGRHRPLAKQADYLYAGSPLAEAGVDPVGKALDRGVGTGSRDLRCVHLKG